MSELPAAAVRSVPRPAADHVEVGDEVAGAVDHVLAAGCVRVIQRRREMDDIARPASTLPTSFSSPDKNQKLFRKLL